MLTKTQQLVLNAIFSFPIARIATWGGGTALSELYLHHRRSDDIDIILSEMPIPTDLTIISNKIKGQIKALKKESFSKMNRFQYIFTLKNQRQQKLEFVYYPFPKLGKIKKIGTVKAESLRDIAVAKTLAAYQRKEVKDAFDLYIILSRKKMKLNELVAGVEKKFEEVIDPAHLLAKLMKSLDNFDLIKLYLEEKISRNIIAAFFQKEFSRFLETKI